MRINLTFNSNSYLMASWFTPDFMAFLHDLYKNNNRDWFQLNKQRFEKHVKEPFEHFVAELINRIQREDPTVQCTAKQAIFRIYRDTRFSNDKTPYKTHMAAVISAGNKVEHTVPGFYLHVGPGEIMMGGGAYMPDKDFLTRIRTKIAQEPGRVQKLLQDKTFARYYGKMQGEVNKVIPKEFKEAFAQQPLIAHKQFYFMAEYADEKLLLRPDLADFFMEHYQAGKAWHEFLMDCL